MLARRNFIVYKIHEWKVPWVWERGNDRGRRNLWIKDDVTKRELESRNCKIKFKHEGNNRSYWTHEEMCVWFTVPTEIKNSDYFCVLILSLTLHSFVNSNYLGCVTQAFVWICVTMFLTVKLPHPTHDDSLLLQLPSGSQCWITQNLSVHLPTLEKYSRQFIMWRPLYFRGISKLWWGTVRSSSS